jgi:hypothetical protein
VDDFSELLWAYTSDFPSSFISNKRRVVGYVFRWSSCNAFFSLLNVEFQEVGSFWTEKGIVVMIFAFGDFGFNVYVDGYVVAF